MSDLTFSLGPVSGKIAVDQFDLTPRSERVLVVLLIIAFTLLSIGYSLGPIFEKQDETEHFRYVREIALTGQLPLISPMTAGRVSEYHQPPLYYMLAAPIVRMIPATDFELTTGIKNDYFVTPRREWGGSLGRNDNKNQFIHTSAEAFPFQSSETARAVHLVRLFSVSIAVATVSVAYILFRELWPGNPVVRVVALAVLCFWPEVAYIAGSVNNDNLVNLAATVALLLLLRQARQGSRLRRSVWLGVVFGIALLAKSSAVLLVVPAGLVVLRDLRNSWRHAVVTVVLTVAIAGWWYLRNRLLLGTSTLNMLTTYFPQLHLEWSDMTFQAQMEQISWIYRTFWARFGRKYGIGVSWPIEAFYGLLTIVALGGTMVGLGSNASDERTETGQVSLDPVVLVLISFALVLVVSTVYHSTHRLYGNQGRYVFQGVAIWAAMVAFGLKSMVSRRFETGFLSGAVAMMGLFAVIILLYFYLPAYKPLPAPSVIEVPVSYRFEDDAVLIGVDQETVLGAPGEVLDITVYWRALRSTDTDLLTRIVAGKGSIIDYRSFPGNGNLLSTDWQPGDAWAERYVVTIPCEDVEPGVYPLVVRLIDTRNGVPLSATDVAGNSVPPVVGRVIIEDEDGACE